MFLKQCQTKDKLIRDLKETKAMLLEKNSKLNIENDQLKHLYKTELNLDKKDQELSFYRQSNWYKRLARKEDDLKADKAAIEQHKIGNCQKKIEDYKHHQSKFYKPKSLTLNFQRKASKMIRRLCNKK